MKPSGDSQRDEDDRQLDAVLYSSPGLYAMLAGFLDESYMSDGSHVFVVAGILYDLRDVKRFNKRWRKELQGTSIRHFHAVDQAHLRGEFEGKTHEEADAIYRRFLHLLRPCTCGSVTVCAFPNAGFDIFGPGTSPFTPYTMCAYACMSKILLRAMHEGQQVTFFIEDGADGSGELSKLIRHQRATDELWSAKCKTWQFVQKEDVPAIQTADILAYETRKRVCDLDAGRMTGQTRQLRKSLNSIIGEDDRHELDVLDQRSTSLLLGTLGIK